MRARFARHRSLVVRLTGVSALIAVSSIAATAWLAAESTTRAIRQEQGQALSGDASIAQAGTPFMLLVPAAELERGARYSLTVRSADTSNALIGEYDFDVS